MKIAFYTEDKLIILRKYKWNGEIIWRDGYDYKWGRPGGSPSYIKTNGYKSWYKSGLKMGHCYCDCNIKNKERMFFGCVHP